MNVIDTTINDVKLIEPNIFSDSRGFFMETWNEKKFEQTIGKTQFVQDNHSKSCKGTLRGLHYQLVNTQGKLVRVVSGVVYDVVVDLRKNSSTFGKWAGSTFLVKTKDSCGFLEDWHMVFMLSARSQSLFINVQTSIIRWQNRLYYGMIPNLQLSGH